MIKNCKTITREDAINLLIKNVSERESNNNQPLEDIDEYGNYVFSTDIKASEPNNACSTSEGYDHFCKISVSEKV